MNKVTKKSTKLAIKISAVVFSVLMVAIASIGIYFGTRKKPAAPTIINPIHFAIDTWDGKTSSATDWAKGKDYAKRGDKTYTIDSAESFIHFVKLVNSEAEAKEYDYFQGYTVYLNQGIDLGGNQIDAIGRKLTDGSSTFQGTFDGGYYTIYNGTIKGNGLFGYVENATIKNVGLYNITVNGNSEYVGGIAGTAVNTNISSTYVRLGSVNGPMNVGGIVGNFISSNGEHSIEKSFEDTTLTGKTNYGIAANIDTNSSSGNRVTILDSYYVSADKSHETEVSGFVSDNSIKAVDIKNFSTWDYGKYSENKTWCDYSFIENSRELTFNYPILSKFNKVFNTGSFYEGVSYNATTGEAISTSSIGTAFEMIEANQEGEVNIIVEKVFMDKTAVAAVDSTITLNTTTPKTELIRGETATGELIAGSTGSVLVIGEEGANNEITIDGNREYVEANEVESGSLIYSQGKDVQFNSKLTLKNNVNNTTSFGGALTLYGVNQNMDRDEAIIIPDVTVENCSADQGGGIAVIGGGSIERGSISGCTAINGGGVMFIDSADELQSKTDVNLTKKYGGDKKYSYLVNRITSSASITATRIYDNNVSGNGGGMYYSGSANGSMTNSSILWNTATNGGGIYINSTAGLRTFSLISNCNADENPASYDYGNYISFNNATNGSGGGIWVWDYNVQITRANADSTDGTHIDFNGVVNVASISTPTLYNLTNNSKTQYLNYNKTTSYKSAYGGGVCLHNVAKFTVTGEHAENSSISYNGAQYGGGIFIQPNCSIEIKPQAPGSSLEKRFVFEGNNATTKGGAIYADGSVSLKNVFLFANGCNVSYDGSNDLYDSGSSYSSTYIFDSRCPEGGAIYAGNVNVEDCCFEHNEAVTGGAIYAVNNLTVKGSEQQGISNTYTTQFNYNGVESKGGAIVTATTTQISGSAFISNTSGDNAAAIRMDSGTTTISNCNFLVNSAAKYGGAIGAYGGTTIVDSCTFTGNYTSGWNNSSSNDQACGAIDANGTTITIKNSTFTQNKSWRYGAVVCLNGTLTFEGTNTFTENQAGVQYGGALGVETNGTIKAPDGVVLKFYRNSAAGEGGAICSGVTGTTGSLTLYNAVFEGNTAGSNGGAIYSESALTIVKSNFQNNGAATNGGAVYKEATNGVAYFYSCTFGGNTATTGKGGAVFSNAAYSLYGGELTSNTATVGGALYAKNNLWLKRARASEDASLSLVKFSKNTATTTSSGGGAIYKDSIGQLYVHGAEFSENESKGSGGAIMAYAAYTLGETTSSALTEVVFNSNTAANAGGAIWGYGGTVNSATFTSNSVSTGWRGGGAIFVYNASTYTIHNANFDGNKALAGPGGAYSTAGSSVAGELIVNAATFNNNTAKTYGGAIGLAVDGNTLTLAETGNITFTGNEAKTYGGAIYITSTTSKTITLTGITMGGNKATTAGGAVFMHDSSTDLSAGHTLNVNTGYYYGNEATRAGAFSSNTGHFTLNIGTHADSTNDNLIIGGYYNDSDELVVSGNKATGTTSTTGFGGVYAHATNTNSKETVTITKGTIVGNSSGYVGGAFSTKGSYDSANKVYYYSKLVINGGIFRENTAKQAAGALYIGSYHSGNIIQGDTEFIKNSVTAYSTSNGGAILTMPALTISSALFDGNTATGNGGAIRSLNSLTIGTSNASADDVVFRNNSGAKGGALQSEYSMTIYNATFENNTSTSTTQGGSAISFHCATSTSSRTIKNITLKNNEATFGGAIHISGAGKIPITNITASGNKGANGAVISTEAYTSGSTSYYPTINITGAASFTDNEATGNGGAIHVISGATLNITNTTGSAIFSGNTAEMGGAISGYGNLTITGNNTYSTSFSGNSATIEGGAISIGEYESVLNIANASFTSNTAEANGGAIVAYSYYPVITNCTFTSNEANTTGGALYVSEYYIEFNITDSTFERNTARDGGGAIYLCSYGGQIAKISNSKFISNSSTENYYYGGGAVGMHATSNETSIIEISSCLFEQNSSINGGALRAYGNTTVTDSTFSGNTATNGGAIYNEGTFNWNGGKIYGNKLNTYGKGSAIYNAGGTVNFGGDFVDANGNLDRYAIYSALTNYTVTASTIIDDIPAANFNASPVTYGIATLKVNIYDGYYKHDYLVNHYGTNYVTTHEINLFDKTSIEFDEVDGYEILIDGDLLWGSTYPLTDTSSTGTKDLYNVVNNGCNFVYSYYSLSDSSKLNTTTSFSEEVENLNLLVYSKTWYFWGDVSLGGATQYYSDVSSPSNVFSYEDELGVWDFTSSRGDSLLAWNTTGDLTIDIEQGDTFTSALATATYYAVWGSSETGSVNHTFNLSASSTQTKSTSYTQSVVYNHDYSRANGGVILYDDMVLPTPNTIPSGYEFGGWSTGNDSSAEYQAGQTVAVNGSTTWYAVWNKLSAPDGVKAYFTHTFYFAEDNVQTITTNAGVVPKIIAYNYKCEDSSAKVIQEYSSEGGEKGTLTFPTGNSSEYRVHWSTSPNTKTYHYEEEDQIIPQTDTTWYALYRSVNSTAYYPDLTFHYGMDKSFTISSADNSASSIAEVDAYEWNNYNNSLVWIEAINDEFLYFTFPTVDNYVSDYIYTFAGWSDSPDCVANPYSSDCPHNVFDSNYYESISYGGSDYIPFTLNWYAIHYTSGGGSTSYKYWFGATLHTGNNKSEELGMYVDNTLSFDGTEIWFNYNFTKYYSDGTITEDYISSDLYELTLPGATAPEGFSFEGWSPEEYVYYDAMKYEGDPTTASNWYAVWSAYYYPGSSINFNYYNYGAEQLKLSHLSFGVPTGDPEYPIYYNYNLSSYYIKGDMGYGTINEYVVMFPNYEDCKLDNAENIFTNGTMDGYYLAGWSKSDSGSVDYLAGSTATIPASELQTTYYAVWAKYPTETHEIGQNKFVLHTSATATINASTLDLYNPAMYDYNFTTLNSDFVLAVEGAILPSATKAGYTFAGWTTDPTGTTVEKKAGEQLTANDPLDWYAVWQKQTSSISKTVKFWKSATEYIEQSVITHLMSSINVYYSYDLNKTYYNSSADIDYTEELSAPDYDGDREDFYSWYKYEKGIIGFYEENSTSDYWYDAEIYPGDTISDPLDNYYAIYCKECTSATFTHTFWANANTSFTGTNSFEYDIADGFTDYKDENLYIYSASSITGRNPIIMPTPTADMTPSGYSFIGWATDETSRETYYPGQVLEFEKAEIFYAVYGFVVQEGETLTHTFYVTSNRTDSVSTKLLGLSGYYNYKLSNIESGDSELHAYLTMPTPSVVPTGYTFQGWSTSFDNVSEYSVNDVVKVTSAQTFYAVWKKIGSSGSSLRYFNNTSNGSVSYNSQLGGNFWTYDLTFNSSWFKETIGNESSWAFKFANDPDGNRLTFAGWTSDKNSYVPEYEVGKTYIIPSFTKLYAVYKETNPTSVYITVHAWSNETNFETLKYSAQLSSAYSGDVYYNYTTDFSSFDEMSLLSETVMDSTTVSITNTNNTSGTFYGWAKSSTGWTVHSANSNTIDVYISPNGERKFVSDWYAVYIHEDVEQQDFNIASDINFHLGQGVKHTINVDITYNMSGTVYVNYNQTRIRRLSSQSTTNNVYLYLDLPIQTDLDATLIPEGYTLAGWSTNNDASLEYLPGDSFEKDGTSASTPTFYAVWAKRVSSAPITHKLNYAEDQFTQTYKSYTTYFTGVADAHYNYTLSSNVVSNLISGTYQPFIVPEFTPNSIEWSDNDGNTYTFAGWAYQGDDLLHAGDSIEVTGTPIVLDAIYAGETSEVDYSFYTYWLYDDEYNCTSYTLTDRTYVSYYFDAVDLTTKTTMPAADDIFYNQRFEGLTLAGWRDEWSDPTTPQYLPGETYEFVPPDLYAVWSIEPGDLDPVYLLMHTGIDESVSNAPNGIEVWDAGSGHLAQSQGTAYYSWDMSEARFEAKTGASGYLTRAQNYTLLDAENAGYTVHGWTDAPNSIESKFYNYDIEEIELPISAGTLDLYVIKYVTAEKLNLNAKFYYNQTGYATASTIIDGFDGVVQSYDGTVNSGIPEAYDCHITAPACPTVPSGYTFAGWSENQTPTSVDNLIQPGSTISLMTTENFTAPSYYAVYIKGSQTGTIEHKFYTGQDTYDLAYSTVTYDRVVGTTYHNYMLTELPFSLNNSGATITSYGKLTTPAGRTINNMQIIGWTSNPKGWEAEVECGVEITVNGSTTWYAVYQGAIQDSPDLDDQGRHVLYMDFYFTENYCKPIELFAKGSTSTTNVFNFNYTLHYGTTTNTAGTEQNFMYPFDFSDVETQDGYTFVGWTTDPNSSTPELETTLDSTDYSTVLWFGNEVYYGSASFYAVWAKDTGETATYTFWTSFKDYETQEVKIAEYFNYSLETSTLSSTDVFPEFDTPSVYTSAASILGWTTDPSGYEAQFECGDTIASAETTWYAVYYKQSNEGWILTIYLTPDDVYQECNESLGSSTYYNYNFKQSSLTASDLESAPMYLQTLEYNPYPIPDSRKDYSLVGFNAFGNGYEPNYGSDSKVDKTCLYAVWKEHRVIDEPTLLASSKFWYGTGANDYILAEAYSGSYNEYLWTYDLQNSVLSEAVNYTDDGITVPSIPADKIPDGYEFVGWRNTAELEFTFDYDNYEFDYSSYFFAESTIDLMDVSANYYAVWKKTSTEHIKKIPFYAFDTENVTLYVDATYTFKETETMFYNYDLSQIMYPDYAGDGFGYNVDFSFTTPTQDMFETPENYKLLYWRNFISNHYISRTLTPGSMVSSSVYPTDNYLSEFDYEGAKTVFYATYGTPNGTTQTYNFYSSETSIQQIVVNGYEVTVLGTDIPEEGGAGAGYESITMPTATYSGNAPFVGWATYESSTTPSYSAGEVVNPNLGDGYFLDTNFYAIFKGETGKTQTVNFHFTEEQVKNVSAGEYAEYGAYTSWVEKISHKVTTPSSGYTAPDGLTLAGWTPEEHSASVYYDNGYWYNNTLITITTSDIYAVWQGSSDTASIAIAFKPNTTDVLYYPANIELNSSITMRYSYNQDFAYGYSGSSSLKSWNLVLPTASDLGVDGNIAKWYFEGYGDGDYCQAGNYLAGEEFILADNMYTENLGSGSFIPYGFRYFYAIYETETGNGRNHNLHFSATETKQIVAKELSVYNVYSNSTTTGYTYTLPTYTAPIHNGKTLTLVGWSTSSTSTSATWGPTNINTTATDLYAVWEGPSNTYTYRDVNFYGLDGDTISCSVPIIVEINQEIPARMNYNQTNISLWLYEEYTNEYGETGYYYKDYDNISAQFKLTFPTTEDIEVVNGFVGWYELDVDGYGSYNVIYEAGETLTLLSTTLTAFEGSIIDGELDEYRYNNYVAAYIGKTGNSKIYNFHISETETKQVVVEEYSTMGIVNFYHSNVEPYYEDLYAPTNYTKPDGLTLVGWNYNSDDLEPLFGPTELITSDESDWYAIWSGSVKHGTTSNILNPSSYGDTIRLSFETGSGNTISDVSALRETYSEYEQWYNNQYHNYNLTIHSGNASQGDTLVETYYRLVNNGTNGEWSTSIPELKLTATLPSATLSGYNFVGWSTANDTTSEYTTGSSFTATASTTLYAVWSANYKNSDTDATYTHTFNVYGGTLDDITTKVVVKYTTGTKYFTYNLNAERIVTESVVDQYVRDELTFPSASRTNYTFDGWTSGSTSTTAEFEEGDTYNPTANTTWYAVWAKTFNFYDTSATPVEIKQTYVYNSTANTTTKANPTLTGFEFVGYAVEGTDWWIEDNWTEATLQETISTNSVEQNYFAVWRRTISNVHTYESGSTITGNASSIVVYNTVVNAEEGTIVANSTYTVNNTTNYYGALVEINADVKEDATNGNYQLVKVFLNGATTPAIVTSRAIENDRRIQSLQYITADTTISIVYADAYKLDIKLEDEGVMNGVVVEPDVNESDIRTNDTTGDKEVIVNNSNEVDLTLKVYESELTDGSNAFFGFYVGEGEDKTYVPVDSKENTIYYEGEEYDYTKQQQYKEYTISKDYVGSVSIVVKTPVVITATGITDETFKIQAEEGYYTNVSKDGSISLYEGTWTISQSSGTTANLTKLQSIFTGVTIETVDGKYVFTIPPKA